MEDTGEWVKRNEFPSGIVGVLSKYGINKTKDFSKKTPTEINNLLASPLIKGVFDDSPDGQIKHIEFGAAVIAQYTKVNHKLYLFLFI